MLNEAAGAVEGVLARRAFPGHDPRNNYNREECHHDHPSAAVYRHRPGISARDIPFIQGGILLLALIFVLVNFVVDALYAYVNPKIELK